MAELSEQLVLGTEVPGVVVRELWTVEDDAAYQASYDASRREIAKVDRYAYKRHLDVEATTRVREFSKAVGRVITGVWDQDAFVASVDFRPQPDGSVELGYWTDSRETGKKYASVGTAAIVAYLSQSYQRVFTRVREDNDASAHVSMNAGLRQVAHAAGWLKFEQTGKRPSPFPGIVGAENAVEPDGYIVVDGADRPVLFRPGGLVLVTGHSKLNPDPLPGVYHRGIYTGDGPDGGKPIVSFRYNQLDEQSAVRTAERVILWEGTGYGVRPENVDQPPTWYLIGPELGVLNHQTGQAHVLSGKDMVLTPHHYSIACIPDGPFGVPLLANPQLLKNK